MAKNAGKAWNYANRPHRVNLIQISGPHVGYLHWQPALPCDLDERRRLHAEEPFQKDFKIENTLNSVINYFNDFLH